MKREKKNALSSAFNVVRHILANNKTVLYRKQNTFIPEVLPGVIQEGYISFIVRVVTQTGEKNSLTFP